MSDDCAEMTEPEMRGRIALLEQVVARIMSTIAVTATPDMLSMLNELDKEWCNQVGLFEPEDES